MAQKELPLKFEQIRPFGKVFADTRKLIRENFSVFFRTMLFLVGPIALFTCTVHTFYQVNIIGEADISIDHLGSYIGPTVVFMQLRWLINGLVTAVVVSHFMKVYREKGPGKFDVNDVTKSLFRDFGGSLLTAILMFLFVAFISVALAGLIFGVAKLSPVAGVMLAMVGYLGYFLIRFPFWYFVYGIFHARFAEPGMKNPFTALSLHGRVFSGNWWVTWAVFFVMWAMLTAIGWVISLPAEVLGMASGIYDIDPTRNKDVDWVLVQSILTSLGEFARTLIFTVFSAAIALHFYSLREKKYGTGTMELLDQIGKTKDDDHIELTY